MISKIEVPPPALADAAPAPKANPSPADIWLEITARAAATRKLRTIIDSVGFVSIMGGTLLLNATPQLIDFVRGSVKDIEELAAKAAGRALRVVVQTPDGTGPSQSTAAVPTRSAAAPAVPAADLRQHPLVKLAQELFGATVRSIEAKPPDRPASRSADSKRDQNQISEP